MLGSSRGSWLQTYQSDEISGVWDAVYDLIEPVVERYEEQLSMSDIFHALADGRFQLWTSWKDGRMEAALLTCIQEAKGVRFCTIYAVAGENMISWVEFMPELERWARDDMLCDQVRIHGRRGWAKVLGMKVHSTEMRKDL